MSSFIGHELVSKVCKSVKATERLISLSGRKLVNDVPTRWNSNILVENDGGQFRENCVWTSRVVRPQ